MKIAWRLEIKVYIIYIYEKVILKWIWKLYTDHTNVKLSWDSRIKQQSSISFPKKKRKTKNLKKKNPCFEGNYIRPIEYMTVQIHRTKEYEIVCRIICLPLHSFQRSWGQVKIELCCVVNIHPMSRMFWAREIPFSILVNGLQVRMGMYV